MISWKRGQTNTADVIKISKLYFLAVLLSSYNLPRIFEILKVFSTWETVKWYRQSYLHKTPSLLPDTFPLGTDTQRCDCCSESLLKHYTRNEWRPAFIRGCCEHHWNSINVGWILKKTFYKKKHYFSKSAENTHKIFFFAKNHLHLHWGFSGPQWAVDGTRWYRVDYMYMEHANYYAAFLHSQVMSVRACPQPLNCQCIQEMAAFNMFNCKTSTNLTTNQYSVSWVTSCLLCTNVSAAIY